MWYRSFEYFGIELPITIVCVCMCEKRRFVLTDINECTEDTDDCSHDCYNTVGSYLCDCPTGYELDTDEINCIGNCKINN